MEHLDADVCIVGAGYAGLTAARRLDQAGRHVVVLEARDRVGGRVWTRSGEGGTPLDMGGTFLGPHQDRALGLAAEMGVDLYPHQRQRRLAPGVRRSAAPLRGGQDAADQPPGAGQLRPGHAAGSTAWPRRSPSMRRGTRRRPPSGTPRTAAAWLSRANVPTSRGARHARGDPAHPLRLAPLRGVLAQRAVPHQVGRRADPLHVRSRAVTSTSRCTAAPSRSPSAWRTTSATSIRLGRARAVRAPARRRRRRSAREAVDGGGAPGRGHDPAVARRPHVALRPAAARRQGAAAPPDAGGDRDQGGGRLRRPLLATGRPVRRLGGDRRRLRGHPRHVSGGR